MPTPTVELKLLKTGTVYTLTRDEHAPAGHLKLKSKQVSKDHAKYKVGQHSADDVTQLDIVPTLKLSNSRDVKPLTIRRGSETFEVHSTADTPLHSGDVLVIGSGRKTITALWQPLILMWRPSGKELGPATKICASIGVKLTMSFVDSITHYLTPSVDLSDACLASLLVGASLITKAWIDRVFELAQLPPESDGLDDTFLLPDPKGYMPPFAEQDAQWTERKLWIEDSARETIFSGLRFLIVSDGPLYNQFGSNIVKCGGTYDAFNVRDGLDKWEKTVSASAKRAGKPPGAFHSALVIVMDEDDIKPALMRQWNDLLTVLHNAELKYVSFKTVRIAILDKKVKLLDCHHQQSINIEAQFIPGTIAEEPSQLAPSTQATEPPRRRTTRRGTTPAESQTSSQLPEESQDSLRRGTKRLRAESVDPSDDDRETKRITRRTRGASAAPEPAPEPGKPTRTSGRTRATSVAPEPAPTSTTQSEQAAPEDEDIFAPPKRPLRVRRTRQGLSALPGLDDDTTISSGSTQPEPPTASTSARVNDELARPIASLKRRAASRTQSRTGGFSLKIGDDDDDDTMIGVGTQGGNEAPLQKFRALFEGTEDPNTIDDGLSFVDLSRTGASKAGTATQLSAVMEVDEDEIQVSAALPVATGSSVAASTSSSGTITKRRRGEDEDGDLDTSGAASRAAKKRKGTQLQGGTVQKTSTQPTQVKGDKTGAVGGVLSAPDKNDHVLKALASMKRGKRTEDDFDREFNALRISKPQSEQERREEEEEEFFAHFDFAEQLRGKKCIEVREYVLPERASAHHVEAIQTDGRGPLGTWKPHWEGVPNFKKFKKVIPGSAASQERNRGTRVELICPEEKDFGMGNAYWSRPSGNSQSQSQSNTQSRVDDSLAQPEQFRLPDFDVSGSEEPAPRPTKSRGGKAATASKKAAPKKATPLFIDDDDEDQLAPSTMDVSMDESAPSTLAATLTQSGRGARGRTTATQSKPTVTTIDSDSDDGLTFKSFRKKAAGRR